MSRCVYVVFWECPLDETKAVVALEFPRKLLDEYKKFPRFAQERAELDARYYAAEIIGSSFLPFRLFEVVRVATSLDSLWGDVAIGETTDGVRYKARLV